MTPVPAFAILVGANQARSESMKPCCSTLFSLVVISLNWIGRISCERLAI
jgi:hypothetical protein